MIEVSSDPDVLPIEAYGLPIGDEDYAALKRALIDGNLIGNGPICQRVESKMSEIFQVEHVLLTASCTAALEMAMLALEIGPGDEVILPSFTFVSTANCIVLRGAQPVFADIFEDTLNLDIEDVKRRISPRTRAIIPVHYAGVACDMEALLGIANEYDLAVVEDAAQGLDAKYRGRYLGTIGSIGCYSLHATKNITCGEGGVFLTNERSLAEKAEIIREKGTNRAAFFRGEVDKYTWVSHGSSYILSDLLAALLESQLDKRKQILRQRKHIWDIYRQELSILESEGFVHLPVVPADREINYHIFYLRTQTSEIQQQLIEFLRRRGVPAAFHYIPLHSSPYGRAVVGERLSLPVTERCANSLVRLPIGTQITEDQASFVVNQVNDFFKH